MLYVLDGTDNAIYEIDHNVETLTKVATIPDKVSVSGFLAAAGVRRLFFSTEYEQGPYLRGLYNDSEVFRKRLLTVPHQANAVTDGPNGKILIVANGLYVWNGADFHSITVTEGINTTVPAKYWEGLLFIYNQGTRRLSVWRVTHDMGNDTEHTALIRQRSPEDFIGLPADHSVASIHVDGVQKEEQVTIAWSKSAFKTEYIGVYSLHALMSSAKEVEALSFCNVPEERGQVTGVARTPDGGLIYSCLGKAPNIRKLLLDGHKWVDQHKKLGLQAPKWIQWASNVPSCGGPSRIWSGSTP